MTDRQELNDWLDRSEQVVLDSEGGLEELKLRIAQNGIEGNAEQLVFDWFSNFREIEKRKELE